MIRLPGRSLRDEAVRTLTMGALGVVAAATLARPMLGATPAYPLKAVMLFVIVMGIAIGHLHQGHPYTRFGAANRITSARVGIVGLVAGLLGDTLSANATIAVPGAAAVALVLDGLDGYAARRTKMASGFGARFDMETDAFFILVLSALVWRAGKAGAWILLAGLMRYLFVAALQMFTWMRRQEPASIRRKAICLVQVLGLSLVMLPLFAPPVSTWWCAAVLATLFYSFGVDTLWLWRHRLD
ncbi:MAG: CDP-alcohol phosphatidyltransferase family protein [Vicinamibacterales bacterium]